MPKATVIIIGSNYDKNQEQGMKFISELLEDGYEVTVKSIDRNPIIEEAKTEGLNLSVDRICLDFGTGNNLNKFVTSLELLTRSSGENNPEEISLLS